jgi:hypothetical protein
MSADTEIDLAPFKKGDVTPTTVGDLSSHTGSIHWNNSFVGNTIPSTSVSAIYGQGNVIQPGVNGIIVGNGKMLDQTGIVTERLGADVANVKTLNLSGGLKYPVKKTIVDYYITTNDYIIWSSGVNLYLPPSNVNTRGQVYIFKNESSTTTIYPFGTDVIDVTLTSYVLGPLDTVTLFDNGGTGWFII